MKRRINVVRLLKFIAVFVLAFQLASPVAAMTGNSGKPAHYLALGDSLAAGMIENGTIGNGYADYLAEELEEEKLLASYNKGFAYPGYKTTDILADLEKNVVKPSSETGKNVKLHDEIQKADVITLSIGANDVLEYVKPNAQGQYEFDILKITAGITAMAKNFDQILTEIKEINPSADIFVMGYYNPYPYLKDHSAKLNGLVSKLDSDIQNVVAKHEAYFVKVASVLAQDVPAYLPNPLNIHPSEAGYEAIAEQFEGPVKEYIMLVPLPQVIPTPVFKDVEGEAAEYVGKAAGYGFIKGYPDGTFKPNKKLTRVHVTSILARTLQLKATKQAPYKDISKYEAATQAEIAAAFEAGLLGASSPAFRPEAPISRIEVARMLYKAHTSITKSPYVAKGETPFTDMKRYSKEDQLAATMLYELEIATGDKGSFKPESPITRAHAAKMIVNFYEKVMQ